MTHVIISIGIIYTSDRLATVPACTTILFIYESELLLCSKNKGFSKFNKKMVKDIVLGSITIVNTSNNSFCHVSFMYRLIYFY